MIAGFMSFVNELSNGEEARAQLPLVLQQASGVSFQQAAGKAESPAQSLTNFCEHWLYCWRVCNVDRNKTQDKHAT